MATMNQETPSSKRKSTQEKRKGGTSKAQAPAPIATKKSSASIASPSSPPHDSSDEAFSSENDNKSVVMVDAEEDGASDNDDDLSSVKALLQHERAKLKAEQQELKNKRQQLRTERENFEADRDEFELDRGEFEDYRAAFEAEKAEFEQFKKNDDKKGKTKAASEKKNEGQSGTGSTATGSTTGASAGATNAANKAKQQKINIEYFGKLTKQLAKIQDGPIPTSHKGVTLFESPTEQWKFFDSLSLYMRKQDSLLSPGCFDFIDSFTAGEFIQARNALYEWIINDPRLYSAVNNDSKVNFGFCQLKSLLVDMFRMAKPKLTESPELGDSFNSLMEAISSVYTGPVPPKPTTTTTGSTASGQTRQNIASCSITMPPETLNFLTSAQNLAQPPGPCPASNQKPQPGNQNMSDFFNVYGPAQSRGPSFTQPANNQYPQPTNNPYAQPAKAFTSAPPTTNPPFNQQQQPAPSYAPRGPAGNNSAAYPESFLNFLAQSLNSASRGY